jgi:hypothetical protein
VLCVFFLQGLDSIHCREGEFFVGFVSMISLVVRCSWMGCSEREISWVFRCENNAFGVLFVMAFLPFLFLVAFGLYVSITSSISRFLFSPSYS